jgi:hypothetical protein
MMVNNTQQKKQVRVRFLSVLLFMAIFTSVFAVASNIELSPDDQKQLKDEITQKLETAKTNSDSSFIFLNNVVLGLLMFIPMGIGLLLGFGSAFATGLAVGGFELEVPAFLLLYLTPFGFMELVAYSLALSRSFTLTVVLIKRRSLIKAELKPTLIEVGLVVGLLFFAGIIENIMLGIV